MRQEHRDKAGLVVGMHQVHQVRQGRVGLVVGMHQVRQDKVGLVEARWELMGLLGRYRQVVLVLVLGVVRMPLGMHWVRQGKVHLQSNQLAVRRRSQCCCCCCCYIGLSSDGVCRFCWFLM